MLKIIKNSFLVVLGLIMLCGIVFLFSGCSNDNEEPTTQTEPLIQTPPCYRIIVDEETLVQYIQWNSNPDYPMYARLGGMTVRMKADGTPYTIDREDLDKYTHFRFTHEEETT